MFLLCLVDDSFYDAPDLKIRVAVDGFDWISGVLGDESDNSFLLHVESFDGESVVEQTDCDTLVEGVEAAVDDDEVAVVHKRLHGVAAHPSAESGGLVLDELLVEVEIAFYIVLCGRWESSGDADVEVGQSYLGGEVGGEDLDVVCHVGWFDVWRGIKGWFVVLTTYLLRKSRICSA